MTPSFKSACEIVTDNMTSEVEKVLDRVCETYTTCKRFTCQAYLRRAIQTDVALTSKFIMNLSYAYQKRLMIEWWEDRRPSDRRFIVATDKCALRISPLEFEWKEEKSVEDALAGDAGVSSGLLLHIPSLLIGYKAYSLFQQPDQCCRDFKKSGELIVISGLGGNSIKKSVTIRKKDNVILNIREQYLIQNGMVECESEYQNIEIVS